MPIYFYNPKSKNFKGVARTPKDYDNNGKLKKLARERQHNFRKEQKRQEEEDDDEESHLLPK